jgi:hypothetical protein
LLSSTRPDEENPTMPPTSRYVSALAGAPNDLSDAEREVVFGLAIAAVAHRYGITSLAAATQLDRAAERGVVRLEGDDETVVLTVGACELVRISRRSLHKLRTMTTAGRPA